MPNVYFDPSPAGSNAANNPGIPEISYNNGQMILNVPSGSSVVTNVGGSASNTLDNGSGGATITGNLAVTGTTTLTGAVTLPAGTTGSTVKAALVTGVGAVANTDTVISPVLALVAGSTLKVGSVIDVIIHGTCTSSNASSQVFTIRAGTAGTTADASVATVAVTAATTGTSIPFELKISFTVQTLGASGTAFGSALLSNVGVTGIAAAAVSVVPFTSSTLATTTATKLEVSYISGNVGTTVTFQDAVIKVSP